MSFMNPLTEPGMESTQMRDPEVPEPAASPESVTRLAGSVASQAVAGPEPTEPAAAGSDSDAAEPVATEPSSASTQSPEVIPAEVAAAEVASGEVTAGEVTGEVIPAEVVAGDVAAADVAAGEVTAAEVTVRLEPLVAAPTARGDATGAVRVAAGRTWALARGMVALIGRYKLETVAVLLLGVGGAVYPPVWVLGALVALPSRTWDLRDKWTGLVAPVLLVIVSTVLIVVFGGKHPTIGSYAFEAWLGAGRASRIAAVLGAGYLAWRLRHGRREPKHPPWNVPHRLG